MTATKMMKKDKNASVATGDINYCNIVSKGGKTGAEMERFGHAGQVNSRRGGGENTVECMANGQCALWKGQKIREH
jgi:hypothetical protein